MKIDRGERLRFPGLGDAGHIADERSKDLVPDVPGWIILDVEGTLVPTDYVHTTLFDYARQALPGWIDRHANTPTGREALADVRRAAGLPDSAGANDVMTVLDTWIRQDRKEPALKVLQGFVWQQGYASGELRTPLFPDVLPALRRWRAAGHQLGIFSSGSVAAQHAVFSRTEAGDLRDLFAGHFDPRTVGAKRAPEAYHAMRARLTPVGVDAPGAAGAGRVASPGAPAVRSGAPVFLSDVPAELDAAAAAGWRTIGVARADEPYGTADFGPHPAVASLDGLGRAEGVRR